MKAPFATAVAIITGLLVLAGYIVPIPFLVSLRTLLLGWAVILVAVATLVGIINLFRVHWNKAIRKEGHDYYSIIFLVAFLLTVAAGAVLGPTNPNFQQAVLSIQVPAESSLMALLAIVLAYASLRLLQNRKGILAVLFVFSAVIFLFLSSGLLAGVASPFKEIIDLLNRLPVAGARGILLGIALGSLVAGLRILMGADRPYRG
jgi:hypothetical protein